MLLALTQLRIVSRKQRFFSSAASVLSRRSDFSLKTLNFFQNSNHVLNGSTGAISRPVCRCNAGSAVPSGVPHDDGMSRYPSFTSSRGVLRGLDYFGTVVFASSGAITAASCGLDLLGCVALGTITAVGGGTIRDVVILGRAPFWSGPNGGNIYFCFEIQLLYCVVIVKAHLLRLFLYNLMWFTMLPTCSTETEYLWISFAAALAAFFLYPILGSDVFDSPTMNAADAVGLGAFCVIGAQNGIRAGLAWPLCILCGVSTGKNLHYSGKNLHAKQNFDSLKNQ